jgi:hypothetical protein
MPPGYPAGISLTVLTGSIIRSCCPSCERRSTMVASCGSSKPSFRQDMREDWRYHATLSGCPQGSILSPVLANIYLDKLDTFVETELLPAYTRGHRRRTNPAYASWQARARR